MKPGDFVKRKGEEEYALVIYSSSGISLYFYSEEKGLSKTLGDYPHFYEKDWEVVKKLPSGWEVGKFGCPVKI